MNFDLDKKRINIFAAHTKIKRVIGHNNDIPWKYSCKGDLKFLTLITKKPNTAIIMGRITFQSLRKPLPGRLNIVITSGIYQSTDEVLFFNNFKCAVDYCRLNDMNICVFGGVEIYKEAFLFDYKLFCTVVEEEFHGDRFFPECNKTVYDITEDVDKFLKSMNAKVTWDLVNNKFYENSMRYKFYVSK